ncbi:site-specific integrase [Rhizobium leguminosarum]|nr:site-specific integrase [Rhizobium leguminosarum]
MTGCRRDEIAALKWCEVDFEQCCLVLEKTKTGRSIRPLAAPALMLLSSLPRYSDSPFVFPASSGDGYYQGTKRVWPKIVKKAKLPGLTPHILRHSVGAAAVSSGETLQMAGYLLGHASHRSTAIYAHIAAHPGARAADRTIGGIAAALGGKQAAPVAPLPQRKAER